MKSVFVCAGAVLAHLNPPTPSDGGTGEDARINYGQQTCVLPSKLRPGRALGLLLESQLASPSTALPAPHLQESLDLNCIKFELGPSEKLYGKFLANVYLVAETMAGELEEASKRLSACVGLVSLG